jgi:hypothetical protein
MATAEYKFTVELIKGDIPMSQDTRAQQMGTETPRSCLAPFGLQEEVDRSHVMDDNTRKVVMEMLERVDQGNITWDRVRRLISNYWKMPQLITIGEGFPKEMMDTMNVTFPYSKLEMGLDHL